MDNTDENDDDDDDDEEVWHGLIYRSGRSQDRILLKHPDSSRSTLDPRMVCLDHSKKKANPVSMWTSIQTPFIIHTQVKVRELSLLTQRDASVFLPFPSPPVPPSSYGNGHGSQPNKMSSLFALSLSLDLTS